MPTREEQFYETASRELAENKLSEAIWAKAFSLAVADEQKAKALYIKLRVEQLERDNPFLSDMPIALAPEKNNPFPSDMPIALAPKVNNPWALWGFIVGLVSVVFFWIGIIPLIGLVLSVIGLTSFKPESQKNKWMAGVGLCLSIIYTLMYMREYVHLG